MSLSDTVMVTVLIFQVFPLTYQDTATSCPEPMCDASHCFCTHILKFPLNSVVQLTFLATINTRKYNILAFVVNLAFVKHQTTLI